MAVYASRKRLEVHSVGSFRNVRRVLEDLARSLEIAARNQARSDRPEYYLVRYEELIDKPKDVVARLARFLRIEPGSSLLRPTVANLPASSNSSFGPGVESGSILANAQGRHRDSLTAYEQELVAAFAADAAGALGCQTRTLTTVRKRLLKMKVRYAYRALTCFRHG